MPIESYGKLTIKWFEIDGMEGVFNSQKEKITVS